MASLLGIVAVIGGIGGGVLRAIPCFLRRGERLQAALAPVQVLVLAAAASGVFAGGR